MMQNKTNSARVENVVGAPVYGARAAPRFTIAEHVHTSRGIPIFICVVDDRIDQAEYRALRNQARKQGGWYSRPWENAPGGFAFMDRAAAERFAEPVGPDDAEEADSAHEPVPPIAAKLRALAEDMRFEIDTNLAERSTSTPKRRFYAALAWVDGHRLLRTQAALSALADAHIAKTVPTELSDIERISEVYDRMGTLFDRSSAEYYDIGIDTGEPQCDTAAARALWRLIGTEDPVDPSAELLEQDGISTSADRASDDAAGLPKMQRLVIHKQRLPILAARTDEISIPHSSTRRNSKASTPMKSNSWNDCAQFEHHGCRCAHNRGGHRVFPITKEQRRAIHLKWQQADQGLSYRAFRKLAIPVTAADGAVALPWCGMWLCIEADGYTHS